MLRKNLEYLDFMSQENRDKLTELFNESKKGTGKQSFDEETLIYLVNDENILTIFFEYLLALRLITFDEHIDLERALAKAVQKRDAIARRAMAN